MTLVSPGLRRPGSAAYVVVRPSRTLFSAERALVRARLRRTGANPNLALSSANP
jgi:hypothetical protein